MNKDIFLGVERQLKTLEPTIKYWYDFDIGQLEELTERPSVSFPCALVKINYQGCVDMSNEAKDTDQRSKVIIQIKFGFDIRSATSGVTPTEVRDKALEIFDTLKTTHLALQGASIAEMSTPLSRNSCTNIPNRNKYTVYLATYECELID